MRLPASFPFLCKKRPPISEWSFCNLPAEGVNTKNKKETHFEIEISYTIDGKPLFDILKDSFFQYLKDLKANVQNDKSHM